MDELLSDVELDEGGRLLATGRGTSIFTDGADWEDLRRDVQEVVEAFYFDSPKPRTIRLHMVHEEVLVA